MEDHGFANHGELRGAEFVLAVVADEEMLHDADMGVFQITPVHTTDTSSEGESDTTSQDKTITAVVTATFVLK